MNVPGSSLQQSVSLHTECFEVVDLSSKTFLLRSTMMAGTKYFS